MNIYSKAVNILHKKFGVLKEKTPKSRTCFIFQFEKVAFLPVKKLKKSLFNEVYLLLNLFRRCCFISAIAKRVLKSYFLAFIQIRTDICELLSTSGITIVSKKTNIIAKFRNYIYRNHTVFLKHVTFYD